MFVAVTFGCVFAGTSGTDSIGAEPVVAMVARSKTKRLATHRFGVAEAVSHRCGRKGPVLACGGVMNKKGWACGREPYDTTC